MKLIDLRDKLNSLSESQLKENNLVYASSVSSSDIENLIETPIDLYLDIDRQVLRSENEDSFDIEDFQNETPYIKKGQLVITDGTISYLFGNKL